VIWNGLVKLLDFVRLQAAQYPRSYEQQAFIDCSVVLCAESGYRFIAEIFLKICGPFWRKICGENMRNLAKYALKYAAYMRHICCIYVALRKYVA